MKKLILLTFALLASANSFADKGPEKGPVCKNPKDCEGIRPVCFNVFCEYKSKDPHSTYNACSVGTIFWKDVSDSGKEIGDNSIQGNNPDFEVECDKSRIFNSSGHRYTDFMGTRIQAQIGPWPAITLPHGALADGHRYVLSDLELGAEKYRGFCYIYTGPQ